jgi:hypothetical protein
VTAIGRLSNVVKNSLVVNNLRGRNRSRSSVLASIKEGSDLLIKDGGLAGLGEDLRDLGLNLLACYLVINYKIAADSTVPALGGRNTK